MTEKLLQNSDIWPKFLSKNVNPVDKDKLTIKKTQKLKLKMAMNMELWMPMYTSYAAQITLY